jgi:hypothetical protein
MEHEPEIANVGDSAKFAPDDRVISWSGLVTAR